MIQVREYARLTTDTNVVPSLDCGIVTEATLDWLQDLTVEWKGSHPIALINGHRSVKLTSYVGIFQSPTGECIEVLPKTRLGAENPLNGRQLLQQMLLSAMGIEPRIAGPAELMRMRQPLHEWIFHQFLTELQSLVRHGLRFDYQRIEEESRFIRGQLQVARQQRQPPGRAHMFQISHDVFTPNRLENRLLKTALDYVLSASKNNENWRLANELSHWLADIPKEPSPLHVLPQWRNGKLMQAYESVKPWCELILERLNPNFQLGKHKAISLLFPMEQLFEKYVENSLKRHISVESHLKPQARSEHLVRHQKAGNDRAENLFQLKPDLLMHTPLGNHVLDIKWKLLNQTSPQDAKNYGIAQSDLYQLFAYGHKYQHGQGHMMLIYPKHDEFFEALPPFHFSSDLVIWAVPFCLEMSALVKGDWQAYFPYFEVPDLRESQNLIRKSIQM